MAACLRKLTFTGSLTLFLLFPAFTRAETPVQAWGQRFNGAYNVYGQPRLTMAVDGNSNVVVAGWCNVGFATIEYSNAGVPLWTNLYQNQWDGEDVDQARGVAVDGSNNVVVTGLGYNTGTVGDYVTVKYSSGGAPLWTNIYDGPATLGYAYDQVSAVVADHGNNVIVTGSSSSDKGGYDYATIKYSADGALLWINRYDGPAHLDDEAWQVTVDSRDNVIVTGDSTGTASDLDYATIKYSSAGLPLWTNRYDGPGNGLDSPVSIAVDSADNVLVTGWSADSSGHVGFATIKYAGSGVPLWTNRYDPETDAGTVQVVVDTNDNVIVSGWQKDTSDHYCFTTIKYSSAGLPLWTNRYGVANGDAGPESLAVDSRGNVIVTGSCSNTPSRNDYVILKYSSTGLPLWTNLYNGPGNSDDHAQALALDRSGNVFVAGYSTESGSPPQLATLKYIPVPSPLLTPLPAASAPFQLRVDDVLQPGTLVIEASTNLANWVPLFTNTTPADFLLYTDPDATSGGHRFYRAYQFP